MKIINKVLTCQASSSIDRSYDFANSIISIRVRRDVDDRLDGNNP